jgi:hypothetical protein
MFHVIYLTVKRNRENEYTRRERYRINRILIAFVGNLATPRVFTHSGTKVSNNKTTDIPRILLPLLIAYTAEKSTAVKKIFVIVSAYGTGSRNGPITRYKKSHTRRFSNP